MKPGKGSQPKYYLDGELRERFIKLYPIHFNEKLMAWFGISHSTLHRLAREEGLKKKMGIIRKKQAVIVVRTCEKNGYYESLRGKRLPEACYEATRKMRREGFSPIGKLKETDKRKYKRLMKRKSMDRKKLISDERRRVLFGLPQKTRLRVSLATVTHQMAVQKHVMIKKRNYFAHDGHPTWVCYDSETDRSERMEATAVRHGLKVVPADNYKPQN